VIHATPNYHTKGNCSANFTDIWQEMLIKGKDWSYVMMQEGSRCLSYTVLTEEKKFNIKIFFEENRFFKHRNSTLSFIV
jgi:hypothetical protein